VAFVANHNITGSARK